VTWWVFWACSGPPAVDTDPVDSDDAVEADSDTDEDDFGPHWPDTLAGTGLYADIVSRELANGVMPFEVAWPLWSDGAAKERYLWLPDDAVIDVSNPDLWDVPAGTKAWKQFSRDGVLVETRYIERTEADWIRIAYLWREDGTDADPVPDGLENAAGTDHDIPGTQQCWQCHSGDGLIGINAIQLGQDSPDQLLQTLSAAGQLSEPVTGSTQLPGDDLVRDTLGYLHGNCGHCHADSYPLAVNFNLRLRALVGTVDPEDSLVYTTAINATANHQDSTTIIVVPGDPDASQLYERTGKRDLTQMPPTGTELVDEDAHQMIYDWIMSLE
jgi:hypothetical protein